MKMPSKEAATLADMRAFYDGQKNRSLYKANTVRNRLNAIARVETAVNAIGMEALLQLIRDRLDDITRVMANQGASPVSVRTYLANFRSALDDYFNHIDDPLYVPNKARGHTTEKRTPKKVKAAEPSPSPAQATASETGHDGGRGTETRRMSVPLMRGGSLEVIRPNRELEEFYEIQQVMYAVLSVIPELHHVLNPRSPAEAEQRYREARSTEVVVRRGTADA